MCLSKYSPVSSGTDKIVAMKKYCAAGALKLFVEIYCRLMVELRMVFLLRIRHVRKIMTELVKSEQITFAVDRIAK